ncbi:MAG: hypothetical protein DRP85_06060 [Candidatus Makaraimicrobium thalassicum]|nr:MAG: hypothetical protein DRP85_06060 [Candidatus Omnitrophota bacterium]
MKTPSFLSASKGFSMIEMMIAVVIVSVCMVMALRVFSICATAVSHVYNSTQAVGILQDKIDTLLVEAITEDGVEASVLEEDIDLEGRKFTFIQEIISWERPMEEASESGEEGEEGSEAEADTGLCEVRLEVRWGSSGRQRSLVMKTLIPARGFAHEF